MSASLHHNLCYIATEMRKTGPLIKLDDFPAPILKGINHTIYHYTSIQSFRNILRTKEFLLSNYPDLHGDKEELIWAYDTYETVISPIFSGLDFSVIQPKEFYCLCTCSRETNKYLWGNYAQNLSGVTIGIDSGLLYSCFNKLVDKPQIHMSPMDYDREAFIKLCHDSIKGIKPIPYKAPINTIHDMGELLNKIPNYNLFREKRQPVLGSISLQKSPDFALEEEVRIIHAPELLHSPLAHRNLEGKSKVSLPFVLSNKHLINEIVITDKCSLSFGEIKRALVRYGIETKVRVIKSEDIS